MIIDAHAHIGYDYVFDAEQNEEELMKYYSEYGIDGAIVQPFISRPYKEDIEQVHDRIHELCLKNPGRFWGMASINPHLTPEDYEKEAARCVKELGFVGIKMTPIAHAVNPPTRDGRHVLEVARSLNVPVMIHTGAGIPFADPVSLISVVRDFKDVKIILAHCGTDMFFQQALYLAEQFENVYAEPSWLNVLNVKKLIETIGAGRIMFSSDHVLNAVVEIVKYKTAVSNKADLEMIMSGTAIDVFSLTV